MKTNFLEQIKTNTKIVIHTGRILAKEDKNLFAEFLANLDEDKRWEKACFRNKTIATTLSLEIFSQWEAGDIKKCLPYITFMAKNLSPLERQCAILRLKDDPTLCTLLDASGPTSETIPPQVGIMGSHYFWERVATLSRQMADSVDLSQREQDIQSGKYGKPPKPKKKLAANAIYIPIFVDYLKNYLKQGSQYLAAIQNKDPSTYNHDTSQAIRGCNLLLGNVVNYQREPLYDHYFEFCEILGINSAYMLMGDKFITNICRGWTEENWKTFQDDLQLLPTHPGKANPVNVPTNREDTGYIKSFSLIDEHLTQKTVIIMCFKLYKEQELGSLFSRLSNDIELTQKMAYALHEGLIALKEKTNYESYTKKYGDNDAWKHWICDEVLSHSPEQLLQFTARLKERELRDIAGLNTLTPKLKI